jgi:protein arginine kinase activator
MSEAKERDPSTCQECGKAPATVHIRRIAAGEETELKLCLACAQDRGVEPQESPEGGFMADPVTILFKNMKETEGGSGVCQGCGMSFSRFRETGRLGCSRCYEAFAGDLESLIRRVHGATRHTGRVPLREGQNYDQGARLRRLNEDLERAIGAEDYERAAHLRDVIRELESAGSGKQES